MKHIVCLLLSFISLDGLNAQQSTYEQGDSTWLVSSDTSKAKVYKADTVCRVWYDFSYHMKTNKDGELVEDKEGNKHWYHYVNGEYAGECGYGNRNRCPYRVTSPYDVIYVNDPLKILATSNSCLVTHPKQIAPSASTDLSHIDAFTTHWTEKPKYDTIGPVWKQVSDTTPGYNPVMAMQLYEVRVYKSYTIARGPTHTLPEIPEHFAWLDIKKKSFNLAVWEDKTLSTVTVRKEMSINEAIMAGMFNGCPIPNPTFKRKKK